MTSQRARLDQSTVWHNNRHAHILVQEQHLWELHGFLYCEGRAITGMITSLSKYCTCGTSTGICTVWTTRARRGTTAGMSTSHTKNCTCGNSTGDCTVWTMRARRCPTASMSTSHTKNCTCGNSTGDCTVWTMRARHDGEIDDHRRTATAEPLQFSTLSNSKHLLLPTTSACSRTANHLGSCTTCKTRTSTTCTGATGETLWSAEEQDHGNRPLHRNRKSTTCEELRLRTSAVFCTAKRNIPSGPCRP